MNAIGYLWRRSIRNAIVQVFKKPAVLILYVLLAGFLIWSVASAGSMDIQPAQRNLKGYAAVLIGVFLLITGFAVLNGLKQGTALFSMADVNLLFTAPVNARKILLSGIAKQAGLLIIASVYLIFQYPNMRRLAGLDGMALFGLMLSYAILGITTQILSASLYAYCAGAPSRRRRIYNLLTAALAALVVLLAASALRQGDFRTALPAFFGADAWNYVPVIGWARGLAVAIADYHFVNALLFFGLLIMSAVSCTLLLQRTDMDYFEDVLLAAERANQAREDAKAGRVTASQGGAVGRRVKRDQGALYGRGASAFTGRMLREQSRSGRWFLDAASLGAVGGPLISLIVFDGEMLASGGLWAVFGMTAWLMLFLNLSGGISRELTYPTLYLAPQRAWKKLMAILLPQMLKGGLDGVLFAALIVLLHRGSLTDGLASFLVYMSISMLYASGLLLVERILGSSRNKVLIMIVYILLLLLLFVPGMVGAIILGGILPVHTAYAVFAAWNAAVALLVVFLCRNLLHSAEMA